MSFELQLYFIFGSISALIIGAKLYMDVKEDKTFYEKIKKDEELSAKKKACDLYIRKGN